MLKVELHAHTADDPADRIPYSTSDLIVRAAELGYDALAITLHDHQLDLRPHETQAAECGLVLIPGIERTIEGKHVLLINFEATEVEAVRSFDDLRALKRAGNGLVIAPHAFFPGGSCLGQRLMDRHADLFDAVEWNGMFTATVNFNRRAANWAAAHGLPMVGNGDVHRLPMLGTSWSLIEAERSPDAICGAVRAGRVEVVATPHSWPAAARIMAQLITSPARDPLADQASPRRADQPGLRRRPRNAARPGGGAVAPAS